MKSALILPFAVLCARLAAQQGVEVKIPSPPPPAIDPDQKTESWVAPVKLPAASGAQAATASSGNQAEHRSASTRTRPATPAADRERSDQVFVDAPGDGRIWARGSTYKASFDGQGATYIPFFGSEAPRNYPVQFRLRGVRAGGQDVAFKADGEATRADRRVSIARGTVTEVYDLMPNGVEQTFVFGTLPAGGDLVVRLGVTTELSPVEAADGLRFGNDLGHVSYGAAVVLDAAGKRAAATRQFEDGSIVLSVPAAFLADATFPVTIDPVVGTFTATSTATVEYAPDIAYDAVFDRYMVVWEEAFSAADHDICSVFQDANGHQVPGTLAYLDSTTDNWSHARVANLRCYQSFLTVAERGVSPDRQIWGRKRAATTVVAVGTQFEISGNGGIGDKTEPDVGGDGNPFGPVCWTVVWERTFNATDSDIHAQQVNPDATLHNGLIPVDNTTNSHDTHPSIAKSNGSIPSTTQNWTVVWQRTYAPGDEDIHFARIAWDGTLSTQSSTLDASASNDTNPVVSSPTDDEGGSRNWLAVYERTMNAGNRDLVGTLGRNGTLVTGTNLTTLENVYPGRDQATPHVDSDGCRFTVVYAELYNLGYEDWDINATTYHVVYGATLGVTDAHAGFGRNTTKEIRPRITSTRGSGGGILRYGAVWDERVRQSPLDLNVVGVLYDGRTELGGFDHVYTGCNGLGMTPSGECAIGGAVDFQMTGIAPGNLPLMMLGLPYGAVLVCGNCYLGVDLGTATFVSGAALHLPIPCEGAFVGGGLAVQGLTFGVGPCLGQVALSDTVLFVIQ